jgi:DNA-binding transcriptional regulator YhcF (GntR family)
VKINFNSLTPVYIQIAEAIEDDIISGKLKEGGTSYSQLIIAKELNINPATAAKGINLLVSKGILEKQRGSSMTVAPGATNQLFQERRTKNFQALITTLITEATKINLTQNEVITAIKNHYKTREDTQHE